MRRVGGNQLKLAANGIRLEYKSGIESLSCWLNQNYWGMTSCKLSHASLTTRRDFSGCKCRPLNNATIELDPSGGSTRRRKINDLSRGAKVQSPSQSGLSWVAWSRELASSASGAGVSSRNLGQTVLGDSVAIRGWDTRWACVFYFRSSSDSISTSNVFKYYTVEHKLLHQNCAARECLSNLWSHEFAHQWGAWGSCWVGDHQIQNAELCKTGSMRHFSKIPPKKLFPVSDNVMQRSGTFQAGIVRT